MKLYTELQMRQCYEGVLQNVATSIKQSDLPKVDDYINSITPIELPTDEEIEEKAFQVPYDGSNKFYDESFINGAKWMKEHIDGKSK